MDKIKMKRTSVRAAVTRTVTKVDNLIMLENLTPQNIQELKECLDILMDKHLSLKELDKEIDTMITDTNEYEKEINNCEEYNEKLICCKSRINNCLKKYDNNSVGEQVKSTENNSSHSVISNNVPNVSIKLPKLTLEKFSGDSSKWLEFYNAYENSIDKNPCLSKVEKFTYLKSLLVGQAFNCVSGFCLTEENYDSCLKLLKDRYGRKDLIINCHMNKLLNLEPVKYSNNVFGLRKLYDQLEISIRNLNSLNVTSGSYGHLLNPIILKLLPQDLTLEFNRKRASKENFEVTELIEFLKYEIECREATLMINNSKGVKTTETFNRNQLSVRNKSGNYNNSKSMASAFNTSTSFNKLCMFCRSNEHVSAECFKYTDEQKRHKLKKEGRCYKCFLKSHLSSECRSKLHPCENCNCKNHNKLFCFSKSKEQEQKEIKSDELENNTIVSTSHCNISKPKTVLLQTCSVIAQSKNKSKLVRMLIDSGSMKNFITKKLAKELKLPIIRKERLTIYSFGRRHGDEQEFEIHNLRIKNKNDARSGIMVEVLATDLISGIPLQDPPKSQNIEEFMSKRGWELADSSGPNEAINLLLGAEYFWRIQNGNVVRIDENLFVSPTIFGYTLMGKVEENNVKINALFLSSEETKHFDLQAFWKLDSIGIENKNETFSESDLNVINSFNDNLKFNNGRYETKLLWKDNKSELKDNFFVSKQRFLGLENKLKGNTILYNKYDNIIKEQIDKGIIEECTFFENETNCYYMPHRPVVREDKSTTKVRIVYDASSKTKNSLSLNECLISGPNLNPNILDIILKFRIHKIAFCADIEKAFHQIQIAEEDRNFLRFLWFDNSENNSLGFKVYRMCRVPFGVTTSPFILSATIKYHIEGYKKEYSEVVNMLANSLYVDDLFFGADTTDEAFYLTTTAVKILQEANMSLRKFETNSISLKKQWEDEGIICATDNLTQNTFKVLGINWDSNGDQLKLDVQQLLKTFDWQNITKRKVLQTVARIYDPVGFIAPFVIRIKFLIQELWKLGLHWEEKLPTELFEKFRLWYYEIKVLLNLSIPRRYFLSEKRVNFANIELYLFCDASIKGYGAVAYFRDPDLYSTSFVMSKSRVSPLKKLTLPRLELMGAVIASRIAGYLKKLFNIREEKIFCFCDSQIVLHWIRGSANKWKPFIANRVSEIQDHVSPSQWKYCKGIENPADLVSRGSTASDLIKSEVWFYGPAWLKMVDITTLQFNPVIIPEVEELLEEQRRTVVSSVASDEPESELVSMFSSWSKLKRVTAWCLRFLNNATPGSTKRKGFLTISELDKATILILKYVQKREFKEEIKLLKSGKNLSLSSKLLTLNAYLDKEEILRVGGRLRNSNLSEDQKHQIILPKKHHVTDLIVKHFHEVNLHGGATFTMSSLRQKFWIVNCREVVRKIIWKCMKCFRIRTTIYTASQIMADLPTARVVPSRIFSKVGLDFAGPFLLKLRKGRGVKPFRCYVCLFVCFTTKAIHLEIVSDLTSEAFIASLKRFAARRGKPNKIFSDRGTNFVGANRELKRIVTSLSSDENTQNYLTAENIQWSFNPPAAPHFGGLWEAGVKQMKVHLKRTIGTQVLTHEEFHTVISQIEACLNSRPIVPLSSDPNDLNPLTPGHFIIGTALNAIPEPDYTTEKITPMERWKLTQQLFQSFWKRWSLDYLSQLQGRAKWLRDKPNLKINDLVLIKEDNLPPLKWRLGRVRELYPGSDGKVRVVKLKTLLGELKRPIHKLSPLPVST